MHHRSLATLEFAAPSPHIAEVLAPDEPGCAHSGCSLVLGLRSRGTTAASTVAARRSALGTWLFYVADRLLDARLLPDSELQDRHRFHFRRRRWFLSLAVPVAIALGVLVARMPQSLLHAYYALGALSLLYLGVVHLPARARGSALPWFPKELAVALLFAAASALPAWDEARRRAHGMPRHHPLLLLGPLFAALCWLNCVAIEDWEQQQSGLRIRLLAGLTILASGLSLFELFNDPARWLAVYAGSSAALFLVLDRSRLTATGRRIAADLALLTPLFLLLTNRLTTVISP